jgi:hypothetical protein
MGKYNISFLGDPLLRAKPAVYTVKHIERCGVSQAVEMLGRY